MPNPITCEDAPRADRRKRLNCMRAKSNIIPHTVGVKMTVSKSSNKACTNKFDNRNNITSSLIQHGEGWCSMSGIPRLWFVFFVSLEYRVDLPSERCNRWIEAFIVREDLPICCLRKHADILLLRFNLRDSKLRVRMICYHLAIVCMPAVARFTMHAWFNLGVCNNVRCVQGERANFTVLVLRCIEADFSYMPHFAAFFNLGSFPGFPLGIPTFSAFRTQNSSVIISSEC